MNVCRIQEGYIWNTRGITTLLEKLSKILEEMGYQRNEYDWCDINKIIDNKQCATLWHVDDLKISHIDPTVVSIVLADIDAEYGKISKMTITRGKVHRYLGMPIDYSSPSKVIFLMIIYIGKCLTIFQKKLRGGHPHLLHTKSLTFQKMQQTIPIQRRYLPTIFGTMTIYFKEGTSRHPSSSILPIN